MDIIEHLNFVKDDIEKKFQHSFVTKIFMPTKNDLIFSFSKNKNYNLILSINNNIPFISTMNKIENYNIVNPFLNRIKSKLHGAFLESVDLVNNDNIIKLNFIKTTDTYDKIHYSFIFEIFKANSNFILLEDEKIIDAFRYRGLDSKHPILNGLTYHFPNKIDIKKEFKDENNIEKYISNIESFYLKEKYGSIISSLKRKEKTLKSKLDKLLIEKENSQKNLVYKDYGNFLISNLNEFKKGDSFFVYYDNQRIPLKEEFTPIENSQRFFKLYKKAKTSLELIDKYIEESNNELTNINNILLMSKFYNENDYLELIEELEKSKLIKIRVKNLNISKKNPSEPYYFYKNNIKIGFGKNARQNSNLTFKKSQANYKFLHCVNGSGAHVVIFDDSPNNEIIECACEIALYLSNLNDGEVYYTQIKNVKKTPTLGLVNLLKYETFHINKFKNDVVNLIKNANRF